MWFFFFGLVFQKSNVIFFPFFFFLICNKKDSTLGCAVLAGLELDVYF